MTVVLSVNGNRPVSNWLIYVGERQSYDYPRASLPGEAWKATVDAQVPDLLILNDGRIYWRDGAIGAPAPAMPGQISYPMISGNAPIYQGRLTPGAMASLRLRLSQSGFLTNPLDRSAPPPIGGGTRLLVGLQLGGRIRNAAPAGQPIPASSGIGKAIHALSGLHPIERRLWVPDGILINAERPSTAKEAPGVHVAPWPLKTPPPFCSSLSLKPFLDPVFLYYGGADARTLLALLKRTRAVSIQGKTYRLLSLPAPPFYLSDSL